MERKQDYLLAHMAVKCDAQISYRMILQGLVFFWMLSSMGQLLCCGAFKLKCRTGMTCPLQKA